MPPCIYIRLARLAQTAHFAHGEVACNNSPMKTILPCLGLVVLLSGCGGAAPPAATVAASPSCNVDEFVAALLLPEGAAHGAWQLAPGILDSVTWQETEPVAVNGQLVRRGEVVLHALDSDGQDYPQTMSVTLEGDADGYTRFGLTSESLDGGFDVLAMSRCIGGLAGSHADTSYFCDEDLLYISGLLKLHVPGRKPTWMSIHSSGGTEMAMHWLWFLQERNDDYELPC